MKTKKAPKKQTCACCKREIKGKLVKRGIFFMCKKCAEDYYEVDY